MGVDIQRNGGYVRLTKVSEKSSIGMHLALINERYKSIIEINTEKLLRERSLPFEADIKSGYFIATQQTIEICGNKIQEGDSRGTQYVQDFLFCKFTKVNGGINIETYYKYDNPHNYSKEKFPINNIVVSID